MKDRREKVRSGEITLTSKGLRRAACIEGDKFTIVVDRERLECSRFQAAFVSRAIHRVICSDSTVNEFRITGSGDGHNSLIALRSLMNGSSVVITENNCYNLELLCRVLDNDEILNQIVEFLNQEEINIGNCISRLGVKAANNCNFENEAKFIASHFHEFTPRDLIKLKEIDVDVLERILASRDLCLKDEDSLVEFISFLGKQYSKLCHCIEFRFLSSKGVDKFLSSFSFEEADICVWQSICRRLRCEICDWNLRDVRFIEDRKLRRVNIPYGGLGCEFGGIFYNLIKEQGANAYAPHIVGITTSNNNNNFWEILRNQPGRGYGQEWYSDQTPNSWICFEFKKVYVSLQQYTLRSGSNQFFTRWEIEASNDEKIWKSLDSRSTNELCQPFVSKIFDCSKRDSNEFFRFIRMRHIGKNVGKSDGFALSGIKFFGVVKYKEADNMPEEPFVGSQQGWGSQPSRRDWNAGH
jgi:hypothetical protein